VFNVINFRKLLFGVVLLSFSFSYSQKWEIGGFVGGSNYTGDLARNFVIGETNLSVGAFGRYNFNEYWSYKFGFNYGKISGGDHNFKEYQTRNLSFFSNVFELDNRIEFNFRRFGVGVLSTRSSAFVFTGLNVFYFNPKAEYNGTVFKLQPLGTEGQTIDDNKSYLRVNLSVPLGMGYKYSLSENWVLGAELGFRMTFTDYLDDVSGTYPDFNELQNKEGSMAVVLSDRSAEVQPFERKAEAGEWRGNPELKDWYVIAGITLTYRFTPIRCGFSNY